MRQFFAKGIGRLLAVIAFAAVLTVSDTALAISGPTSIGTDISTNGALSAYGNVNFQDPVAAADSINIGDTSDMVTVLGDIALIDGQWSIASNGAAVFPTVQVNTGLLDASGNSMLDFTAASGSSHFFMKNNSFGNNPILGITAANANQGMTMMLQGDSSFRIQSSDSALDTFQIYASHSSSITPSYGNLMMKGDLTADRVWTFQDASGVVPLGTAANNLFFTTTGATDVTLPTSGTLAVTTHTHAGTYEPANANIQTHIGIVAGNPHGTTKADLTLGNVENTALSIWAGTANVVTLGTIGIGVWQGTAIANNYLGTGIDAAKLGAGAVSNTEFGYLDGVTSGLQGQIDGKAASAVNGDITSLTAVTSADRANAGTLSIGGTNATSITIGQAGVSNANFPGGLGTYAIGVGGGGVSVGKEDFSTTGGANDAVKEWQNASVVFLTGAGTQFFDLGTCVGSGSKMVTIFVKDTSANARTIGATSTGPENMYDISGTAVATFTMQNAAATDIVSATLYCDNANWRIISQTKR